MPRNNKRKKKLSNFKKFLCIYCGILLLAGVITLIMLHSLLKIMKRECRQEQWIRL